MPMYSIFELARATPAYAKPKGLGQGYPILYTSDLQPTAEQKRIAEQFQTGYPCRTLAGRPRAIHNRTSEGTCTHCGHNDPTLDRPLGES